MLELIAQVEPMSLPLWAVLALSAAMYPLGFMLGAPCSNCCQECQPCSRCTNRYDGCQSLSSVTVDFERGDTMATTTINGGFADCVADVEPQVLLEENYNFECLPEGLIPDITALFGFDTTVLSDGCGCEYLNLNLGIDVTTNLDSTFVCSLGIDIPIPTSCDSQTVSVTLTPDWSCNGLDFGSYGCSQEVLDFLATLGDITVSFTTAGCDCGACCETDEYTNETNCVENVAENACGQTFATTGAWQGVGTDCDPDPCPQPGACCVNGECYQATEEQCGIDGGAWQAGPCDPNPCT